MASTEQKVFISDIGLAATLLTLQFKLVGLERTSDKRMDFVFAATEGIETAIGDFWGDKTIEVPIQSLFHNFRQLKNRLYAEK